MTTTRPRRQLPRLAVAVAVPLAVLISAGLVVQASRAASTASLDSETNAWRTGVVALTADETSTALFTAQKILPGQGGQRCVRVDYTGTVAADVRLWVEASGLLAPSLLVTVEEGDGGSAADCSGFSPTATLFPAAPLATLAAQHQDAATGLSSWSPTGTEARSYRLTWSLSGGNGAQGRTATASFHWDAQQA